MAWAVTADVDRFDEAADWFRSRVPMTNVQFDALEDKARARAFRIAADMELEAVQTVFDEIARSIDQGTPLDEFQKRVSDKLNGKVGLSGYYTETVFRNWVQTAYNTGRWYQLSDADLVKLRPYWLYDAVLDTRTTPRCKACDGTIKPHDDPWWLTHVPPLHHRCRSSIRALRTRQALSRGVTPGDPDAETADPAWGDAPPLRDDDADLAPKESRFDPELLRKFYERSTQFNAELQGANDNAKAKRKLRDLRDPKHQFRTNFEFAYGEAGRAVAWGKAMENRGLGLTVKRALAERGKLVKAGGSASPRAQQSIDNLLRAKGVTDDGLKDAYKSVSMQELAAFADQKLLVVEAADIRAISALAGHSTSISPLTSELQFADVIALPGSIIDQDKLDALGQRLSDFYRAFSDASLVQPTDIVLHATNEKRGGYLPAFKTVIVGDGTLKNAVHEWAHALEQANPALAARALEFRERRTPGEKALPLRKLVKKSNYGHTEVAKKDRFFDPYMGRVYDGHLADTTECTTMALQFLAELDEIGDLGMVDPHTLYFALGQLAGSKLP